MTYEAWAFIGLVVVPLLIGMIAGPFLRGGRRGVTFDALSHPEQQYMAPPANQVTEVPTLPCSQGAPRNAAR